MPSTGSGRQHFRRQAGWRLHRVRWGRTHIGRRRDRWRRAGLWRRRVAGTRRKYQRERHGRHRDQLAHAEIIRVFDYRSEALQGALQAKSTSAPEFPFYRTVFRRTGLFAIIAGWICSNARLSWRRTTASAPRRSTSTFKSPALIHRTRVPGRGWRAATSSNVACRRRRRAGHASRPESTQHHCEEPDDRGDQTSRDGAAVGRWRFHRARLQFAHLAPVEAARVGRDRDASLSLNDQPPRGGSIAAEPRRRIGFETVSSQ